MKATIYHNPRCGTSRNVLALLSEAGYDTEVIEYLKTGWAADQLRRLFKAAGITAQEALRAKEDLATELNLHDADEETIIAAMVKHPILVNRPFVITNKGTALCRPSETVKVLIG